jgi:hypothetical protein
MVSCRRAVAAWSASLERARYAILIVRDGPGGTVNWNVPVAFVVVWAMSVNLLVPSVCCSTSRVASAIGVDWLLVSWPVSVNARRV